MNRFKAAWKALTKREKRGPVKRTASATRGDIIVSSRERCLYETSRTEASADTGRMRSSADYTEVKARYEAAHWSANRTWLPSNLDDADADINAFSRREVARRMRWFEKNNAACQKILDLIDTNVVGSGITPTPKTTDATFRDILLARWQRFLSECDLAGEHHGYELQSIEARTTALDGEIFIVLHEREGQRGPRIQHVETQRVSGGYDLPDALKARRATIADRDGKIIDTATGKCLGYTISSGASQGVFLPADQVIHNYEPSRARQSRGISLFHAVVNDLHDLDDLQTYAMLASKDAAGIAHVIKTKSGSAPRALIGDDDGEDSGATTVPAGDRAARYRKVLGANSIILEPDDEWDQADNIRPSDQEARLWGLLERRICKGVGISYAAFNDYEGGWSGPALRAAVITDNRFYRVRAAALARTWSRIWSWWFAQERNALLNDYRAALGSVLAELPVDAANVEFHPPRNATVDIGYEANATVTQLRSCQTTLEAICAAGNSDWRRIMEQRSDEVKYAYELARKKGITVAEILSLDAGERAAAKAAAETPEGLQPTQ